MITEKLSYMISKEDGDGRIFSEEPHMTLDNFFSGDESMNYLGRIGFAATMTCRKDRLPSGVPKFYFHLEKNVVDDRNKAARFIQPITAVKSFSARWRQQALHPRACLLPEHWLHQHPNCECFALKSTRCCQERERHWQ